MFQLFSSNIGSLISTTIVINHKRQGKLSLIKSTQLYQESKIRHCINHRWWVTHVLAQGPVTQYSGGRRHCHLDWPLLLGSWPTLHSTHFGLLVTFPLKGAWSSPRGPILTLTCNSLFHKSQVHSAFNEYLQNYHIFHSTDMSQSLKSTLCFLTPIATWASSLDLAVFQPCGSLHTADATSSLCNFLLPVLYLSLWIHPNPSLPISSSFFALVFPSWLSLLQSRCFIFCVQNPIALHRLFTLYSNLNQINGNNISQWLNFNKRNNSWEYWIKCFLLNSKNQLGMTSLKINH